MEEVSLYVTPKSGDTDKIKDFLASRDIEFREYDIHADVKAHKRMLEATRGACGAPVIEFERKIVCGFDPEKLEDTIAYELH